MHGSVESRATEAARDHRSPSPPAVDETSADEQNPFSGSGCTGALLFSELEDELVANHIRDVIPRLEQQAKISTDVNGVHDKIDSTDMLERLITEDEDVYDMPPMKVSVLVRSFPDTSQSWERFGVNVFQTNRHLYIFDNTSDFVNSFESAPKTSSAISSCFELSRYKIGHRRSDDMLLIPLPLTHVKGFELDVHMSTSASTWASHKNRVSMFGTVAALFAGLTTIVMALQVDNPKAAAIFVACGAGFALVVAMLRVSPMIINTPHTHASHETRLVQIGALDPVTNHHMILQMSLDDSYSTDMAKEFLRVLQVNTPQLTGDFAADPNTF